MVRRCLMPAQAKVVPRKEIVRNFGKQDRAHANNARSLIPLPHSVPKERRETERREEKVQAKETISKERTNRIVDELLLVTERTDVIETSTDNPGQELPQVVGRKAEHVETV